MDRGQFGVREMVTVLRDEESGICRVPGPGQAFPTQGSMVSLLGPSSHCHWFTATPLTNRAVFKPFIFGRGETVTSLTMGGKHELGQVQAVSKAEVAHLRKMEERFLVLGEREREATAGEEREELFSRAVEEEIEAHTAG